MKKYVSTIIMLILVLTIKGQEEIKFNTPELSALAKYIESPVNYSNGLVDISIPLYETILR